MTKRLPKTVFIIIDAFRHDYLSKDVTPFLFELSQRSKYYQQLVPSYGFCERTELLVGLTSQQSNYFTAIGFDPQNSPYKGMSLFLSLLELLMKLMPLFFNKVVKRLLWEFVSRKECGFAPLNIPLSQLKFFSLTEDGKGSAITNHDQSLYKIIKERNSSINDESFTALNRHHGGDDDDRIAILTKNIEDDSSLYLLYIADCDKYGHQYGPLSKELNVELKKIDQKIERLYKRLTQSNRFLNWVVIGDHGMTQVEEKVNVSKHVLEALNNLKNGVDYLIFADSTVFRIWVLNEKKKSMISAILEKVFSMEELSAHGTYTRPTTLGLQNDRKYGDFIWLANNGVLISPDNFNTVDKTIKGMHGYDPKENDSSYGMAICNGPDFDTKHIERECLTSIYTELRKVYI